MCASERCSGTEEFQAGRAPRAPYADGSQACLRIGRTQLPTQTVQLELRLRADHKPALLVVRSDPRALSGAGLTFDRADLLERARRFWQPLAVRPSGACADRRRVDGAAAQIDMLAPLPCPSATLMPILLAAVLATRGAAFFRRFVRWPRASR